MLQPVILCIVLEKSWNLLLLTMMLKHILPENFTVNWKVGGGGGGFQKNKTELYFITFPVILLPCASTFHIILIIPDNKVYDIQGDLPIPKVAIMMDMGSHKTQFSSRQMGESSLPLSLSGFLPT